MTAVVPLQANDSIAGTILTSGEVDQFQVTLRDNGRLTASVQTGTALHTRLSLLGPDGQLLIQSDGQSPLNGDGKLDLAVANQGSNDVSILLGHGDGTFAPEQRVPGGQGASFMMAADLNGDGKLDLVIGSLSSSKISVLLGRGDGTFQLTSQ